jgi:hypothetical protein
MREEIKNNLDNPVQLERLYQENRTTFKREFNLIYPDIRQTATAQIWNARLNFENEKISWGTSKELIIVIVLSFIAGLIAKIPDFTEIIPEYFYPRNIGFVVVPLPAAYFAWKHKNQP